MVRQWLVKDTALKLRSGGASIRDIEQKLGVARSTLSGWLKNIELTETQRKKLHNRWLRSLALSRKKASQWHRNQKQKRVTEARKSAEETVSRLPVKQSDSLELALSILYWGEGTKNEKGLALGNSNANVLRFFITALKILYKIDEKRIRCDLHLRSDQKPHQLIRYWSEALNVPQKQFSGTYIDKRTKGRKTFAGYRGVCVVYYCDLAIQRKIMYLYDLYCQRVIQEASRA